MRPWWFPVQGGVHLKECKCVWRFNENGRRGCTWCSNFRVVHCPHIILTPTHVVKIYGKYRKKDKLNSEKIWKIQKKIVKLYGKYGRKASRIVIRYGKYRRK
jgi:hypothetical protein